ncbi:HIT family protein [Celeribacter halophilus]|uniref:HIT family protein n=1 Tax=Celeribacter halophilus TaxID=576117 RepID=UPI001C0A4E63|nr:HIT family protein [Celeribacter halophilus]MBU2889093.1 HIT domain-containing protein [Celeribacter halophilus]MDO6510380.1 HIT domain-containing protein [Celeribacter halophilus]
MRPDDLHRYITERMRMSHVYQPVMLRELLKSDGEATVEQIAKALLSHDRSQVEYYEIRTKNMVGKVLTNNGVAAPVKDGNRIVGYRLTGFGDVDAEVRDRLIAECEEKIADYIERRGGNIWQHRFNAKGYVPGSVRYAVFKRAKYRCELCGASAEDVALHVDHIIPRNRGGQDDLSNFQALCITCNTNKRDQDDADFRGVADSYGHREAGCIFCEVPADRVIAENELCYAIRDGFPVTPLHTLVIPKRHVSDYFDLFQPELNAIRRMLDELRSSIQDEEPNVSGFNVGVNAGASAGQTIFHCHLHLIPRRDGDVPNPRGGVRGVIPAKQSY